MKKVTQGNSEIGETVALIDAMIVLSRIITKRIDIESMICGSKGDKYQQIRDALTELMESGFRKIMGDHDEEAMRIIHEAAGLLRQQADTPKKVEP
jgi:hypothetical protein